MSTTTQVTRLIMRFGAGMVLIVGSAHPALAQPSCGFEDDLLVMADTVLTHRADLPALQARRFGTRAAYLTIRYGEPEQADVATMLDQLVETRAAGADDLHFAWHIATHGLDATLALMGPDALAKAVSTAGLSSIRALLLNGDWDATMAALSAKPAADQAAIFSTVVTALIDQPDPMKADIAAAAGAHGLADLVAGLTASQSDPSAFPDYLAAIADVDERDRVLARWQWVPPMLGNPMPFRQGRGNDVVTRDISRVAIGAALQPEREFLNTAVNYLGLGDQIATVADSVGAMVEDGTLPAKGPFDAGWLATYRGLIAAGLTPETIHEVLGASSFGIGRYGRDKASDVMDWILAVDALTPYLRNETQEKPKSPKMFSPDFADWDHWVALASRVKATPDDPALVQNPDDLPIVAELLFASGEIDALADLLASAPVSLASVSMTDDLAARLDRLCLGSLTHKAEAVLLAGQPIYKF